MTTPYCRARQLAIAAGVAATSGALAILLTDPLSGGAWRLDHALLPLIVAITIAAGHLAGAALGGWRILAAAGFAAIFGLGTLLTVYASVGAQKSGATARATAEVAAHNGRLTAKRSDIERARTRLEQAVTMADREMTGSTCGRRCNDWRLRGSEVAAYMRQLEGDLAGLGAERVAPSRAHPFAEIMGLMGFDAANIERLAATLEPVAFAIIFELTAIVAFGFAFGAGANRRGTALPATMATVASAPPATVAEAGPASALPGPLTVVPAAGVVPVQRPSAGSHGNHCSLAGNRHPVMLAIADAPATVAALGTVAGPEAIVQVVAPPPAIVATPEDDEPSLPSGGSRRSRSQHVATRAAAEADVIRLVARGERLPSQETLARRWGVHKGTASKWLAGLEQRGLVARTVAGRAKAISAA